MTMTPIADAAAQLGITEPEARARTQAGGLHIETVNGVDSVDLEALRAVIALDAIQPRLADLETRADNAVINVQPASGGWIIPSLALLVSAAAAGAAIWVAVISNNSLKASIGFAAVDQVLGGMETAHGDDYRGELVEDRFRLALMMRDEEAISDPLWDAFMTTMCVFDETDDEASRENGATNADESSATGSADPQDDGERPAGEGTGLSISSLLEDDILRVQCEAWNDARTDQTN